MTVNAWGWNSDPFNVTRFRRTVTFDIGVKIHRLFFGNPYLHSCTYTSRMRDVSGRIWRIRQFFPENGLRYSSYCIDRIRVYDTYHAKMAFVGPAHLRNHRCNKTTMMFFCFFSTIKNDKGKIYKENYNYITILMVLHFGEPYRAVSQRVRYGYVYRGKLSRRVTNNISI